MQKELVLLSNLNYPHLGYLGAENYKFRAELYSKTLFKTQGYEWVGKNSSQTSLTIRVCSLDPAYIPDALDCMHLDSQNAYVRWEVETWKPIDSSKASKLEYTGQNHTDKAVLVSIQWKAKLIIKSYPMTHGPIISYTHTINVLSEVVIKLAKNEKNEEKGRNEREAWPISSSYFCRIHTHTHTSLEFKVVSLIGG